MYYCYHSIVFSCGGFIKHSSSEDEDLEIPLLDQFRNQQLEVRVIKEKAPKYWPIIPL